jgi:uncharacterized membrane protein
MWFIFALLSALFSSVRKTNEKQLSHKLHHFTIGWVVQLLSLPVLTVALLSMGKLLNPFTLGPNFWIPTIIIWFGFYPLNTFLNINSMKLGELTKILPLQSLAPIFALLMSWLFIGQRPNFLAIIGILVVTLGVYVLNVKSSYLHNPLKIFTADKANLYTLCMILLSTLAGILTVIALKASEPFYYAFIDTLGAVVVLFVTSIICKIKEISEVKAQMKSLSLAGAMYGGTFGMYLLAINSGPLAYVTTIRTSGALVGAVAAGIYLKEEITKIKIIALILIGVGAVILALN